MLTRAKMVKAALAGLKSANAEYRKWSQDWASDNPVEGLVVAHVARTLFDAGRANGDAVGVTLEDTFAYLRDTALDDAGRRGMRHDGFAKGQRVDIVYWIGDFPKVAIEVKRRDDWTAVERDLVRMRGLLAEAGPRSRGTLSAGIVCHYMVGKWTDDTAKIDRRIQKRAERFAAFLAKTRSAALLMPSGRTGNGSQFATSKIRKISEPAGYGRQHHFYEVGCCYLVAPVDARG